MDNPVYKKDNDQFWFTLRTRVNAYFQENKLSKFSSSAYYLKCAIVLAMFIVSYCALLFFHISGLLAVMLCVVMGLGMAGIGFCISHQAAHDALSPNRKINRLFSLSFNLVGMSDYIWKIKHNVFHHAYTNVYEQDEALKEGDLMRLSENAPYKPIHKYQHFYGFFVYALFTVFWAFVLDFEKFFRYNGNGGKVKKAHPMGESILFFVTKLYYIILCFVAPVVVFDYSFLQAFTGYLIVNVTASLLITHVLQVEHLSEGIEHVEVKNGYITKSWAQNQLEGTCNFKTRNKVFSWFIGGCNYQIEHHLFPRICSVHYPAISKIVRSTANEFGYTYICHDSFQTALVSHYKFLKQLGKTPQQVLA